VWRITNTDQSEAHVIVETSSDVSPPRYFLFDRSTKKMLPLFSSYPELPKHTLSKRKPLRYPARDGHEIES
jgi:dipeptidyl aminopeptidase/acylaminoacyl peptidase